MALQMNTYRELAIRTAQEAGLFLRRNINEAHQVEFKGEINLVTEADHKSETIIVTRIRETYPDHDIMMEESVDIDNGSPFRWVIDPLDGTTNYAHGYPVFCVSVALEFKGETILGVVYNPMLNEMFVAQKGKGALLNGRRIHISETEDISRSLLATGFPYDIRVSPEDNIANFVFMAKRAQAIRRAGSAALDLAYVAAGRFDGFWELKLAPWDTAAGCLMVTEAGGKVTDISGGAFHPTSHHVLASNGKIHERMMEILRNAAASR
ncbi:MAG: inositol monophosphatase family protein [Syntrophales bacterium]|nr:inositol monophosphatase family protein [Syntrophales bacterium]